jgi:hypothetical protein
LFGLESILTGTDQPALIENLILDCLEILARLDTTRVIFIKRVCYNVAHSLTCLANDVGCKSWLGIVPDSRKDSYSVFWLKNEYFVIKREYLDTNAM